MRIESMARSWIVAGVLLCAWASTATAQAPLRVGVIANNAVNLTVEEASEVTLAISSALRQSLEAIVVGDVATQAAAAQAVDNLEQCVISALCIDAMRTTLNVDALLFVTLARIGPTTRVEVRYAAPGSDRTVQVLDQELQTISAQSFLPHARALVPDAQPRATRATTKPIAPVKPPMDPIPPAESEPEPSRFTAPVLIAGGVTLATAIGATTLGVIALGDECNDEPGCDQAGVDSVTRKALITDVLWGATLAGAVVTGYFYWRAGRNNERPELALVPSADGAHVVLGGRF